MTSLFYGLDNNILSFWHVAAQHAGKVLTPIARFFTFIGEKGIWMIVLAVILICFAKTRKIGICLLGAVCCGALITNILLKDMIARPRPYEALGSDFYNWWRYIKAPVESGYSFPSGHVTAAAAGVFALAFVWNRKVLYAGIPYIVLMCASRNYLMAHYPTDVIAGIAVGVFSAITAYAITVGIYAILEKFEKRKLARLVLYDIDAGKLLKKIFKKDMGDTPGKANIDANGKKQTTE
ncbi:MAG: phosphatase PAP2 family protein [Clostridia bacterium]|nr:phosphatase PAP2 family protein [Clostridia bacterium]MCR5055632.1 phosphatase PAP2 family protein [Clostridia bacterium]